MPQNCKIKPMDAIFKRRSIRQYLDKKVSKEDIIDIIKAGMAAPSARNQQPRHFIVIDDKAVLAEIPKVHPHAKMLLEAPAAILVCADPTRENKSKGYWQQDCAAAVENILIAIASKDLGGCWLGIYPRDDRVEGLRVLLNIPEHIIPFALIALGYPAVEPKIREEYNLTDVKLNNWNQRFLS
jgi:nitroreductase